MRLPESAAPPHHWLLGGWCGAVFSSDKTLYVVNLIMGPKRPLSGASAEEQHKKSEESDDSGKSETIRST